MDELEPTGTPPDEGNELVEAPEELLEAPTEEAIEEAPEVEAPAPEPPPEDEMLHKMQSWIGRRDVELRAEMDRRDQTILNEIRTTRTQPIESAPESPDPAVDADAWFDHKTRMVEQTRHDFYATARLAAADLIMKDPLTAQDPRIGEELAAQILSGVTPLDAKLSPQAAAADAVMKAKSNVLSHRMLNKTNPNPLAGNTPSKVPTGGIAPPAAPAAAAIRRPKMSSLATSAAKKWGMTDAEVAKVLR